MTDSSDKIKKVSIIISKGSLDGIYPGLIMANGARMEGIEASVFFTFWPFAFFPVWVEVRVFPFLDTTLRVVITGFPPFLETVSMVFALIRFNTIVLASGKPVTR